MKINVCSKDGVHKCTGCGMCSAVCPHDALIIKEDENGFYGPVADETKCTECEICTKVCYRFDENFAVKENEDYSCFSATHKDEEELYTASSGGVSIELMRECLNMGYYVLGVAYDNQSERAVTKIAKNASELQQFKGSKYFQSYTADAYNQVIADKSEQKYAIFGTPCQIYSFSKIAELKKNGDKYLFVDIFCHGCPSIKVWDKYLDFVKRQNQIEKFEHINFRSKSHGWHEYSFDFTNGVKTITSSKYEDPFHELFFGMDATNEACYDCVARSTVEKTDIRIGDFWGKRYDLNIKGVSAVVIASERGKELFSKVASKFKIEEADFNEIIAAQSYKKVHNFNGQRREKVLAYLSGSDDIKTIVKKYRKMLPVKKNIKRVIKKAFKHLPPSLYLRLKTKLS